MSSTSGIGISDSSNLFQAATTGSPRQYGTLPAVLTPGLLPTIIDWPRERVTIAE